MTDKIVIVGAGVAGLAAGCYARMNGFEVDIYESHAAPGGLCTSWKRKGYTIDGSIDYLLGTGPGDTFYEMWRELGALSGTPVIHPAVFSRYVGTDGRTANFYCDANRLEKHLKELAPVDAQSIELLCRLVRRFGHVKWPVNKPFELMNFFDMLGVMLKMMPISRDLKTCTQTTMGQFAERFKDPLLRAAVPGLIWEESYSLNSAISALSALNAGGAGIPEGGSLEFARRIEGRFVDLGGRVTYNARVASVIEDNGTAVGVRLADGRQVSADHVVSAGDLRSTLYDLLGGNHLDPQHQKLFASVQTLSPIVQVSFGLKTPLSITADSVLGETHQLKKQIKVGNQVFDRIMLKSSGYDSTLAPDGKVVVKCPFVMRDYSYWENLAPDRNAYAAEKSRIASTVADALEDFYPGFKAAIEMTDVATPMTYVRYTGNWKGTFMTWIIPPDKANEFRTIKKTVPGLNNFWLCGMWVQAPGGTPGAAISARQVVQLICHKDRRRFRTSVPAEGRAAAA